MRMINHLISISTQARKFWSRMFGIFVLSLFTQTSFVLGQNIDAAPVPPAAFGKLELITGDNAENWAFNKFKMGEKSENWSSFKPLNTQGQCFESAKDVPSLQSVILWLSSPDIYAKPIDFVSYVCVTGEGAPYVMVNVYPATSDGKIHYQGWDGTKFADYEGWDGTKFSSGPAVSINGEYWYRKHIKYDPEDSFSRYDTKYKDFDAFTFYAKTDLYNLDKDNLDYDVPPFKLWAYKVISETPTIVNTDPKINFTNLIGEPISFRSYNFPTKFIRHQKSSCKLTEIDTPQDKEDASFKVVPALNGASGYVSFESVNYPGYYLRHQGFVLKLVRFDNSKLYQDDASFKGVSGLAGEGYSFESYNYPNHYLRHSGFNMRLDKKDGSDLFNADATYNIDMALSKAMSGYFRLKNKFRDYVDCLEGNRKGGSTKNGNAFMDECQSVTGQFWKMVDIGDGYYRLQTWFQGDGASLEGNDANSDYMNGAAFMNETQSVTGQYWRFEPVGNGYYQLKTMFGGEAKCLEGNQARSDYKNGAAFMDNCQNRTGQYWQFVESSLTLDCENSKTGAKLTLLSKNGQNIKMRLDWDEGATFSGLALDITNGSCESCPRVGGIGRPHGTSAIYEIRQTDATKPVIIKWGGQPGNRKYCGEDRSMIIPPQ